MLYSVAEVKRMIAEGRRLLLAASEWALSRLPRGNWIAGTIPYFVDVDGGVCSESLVFVNEVPAYATATRICQYTAAEVFPRICEDAPETGYSFLVMPAGSRVHAVYAQGAPQHETILRKPFVGWISGTHVSRIGLDRARVYNGLSGEASSDWAIVMHIELAADKLVQLETVNVFTPGAGDIITFPASGFSAAECRINGVPTNFPDYLRQVKPDPFVPLMTNQNGNWVNVSIQGFEEATRAIHFYAPVFAGMEYRFAEPLPDYEGAFNRAMEDHRTPAVFSCNCILNYLYAEPEGKRAGSITGPVTFGEIAHQLLNQTFVRLLIHDARGGAGHGRDTSELEPVLAESGARYR